MDMAGPDSSITAYGQNRLLSILPGLPTTPLLATFPVPQLPILVTDLGADAEQVVQAKQRGHRLSEPRQSQAVPQMGALVQEAGPTLSEWHCERVHRVAAALRLTPLPRMGPRHVPRLPMT